MKAKVAVLALGLLMSLFSFPSWGDQSLGQGTAAYELGNELKAPNGVIEIVVEVAAERIGEPAALYVIGVTCGAERTESTLT